MFMMKDLSNKEVCENIIQLVKSDLLYLVNEGNLDEIDGLLFFFRLDNDKTYNIIIKEEKNEKNRGR